MAGIDGLRHTGIATFMRCPHRTALKDVDIGILGVPYDGGLTTRTGARHGPREVRNQSSLIRRINVATGARPFEAARIADLGDVAFTEVFSPATALPEIEAHVRAITQGGVLPLLVGGDHSISYPSLRAVTENGAKPCALIHVDSHTDTWPVFQGSKFHHGSPFRLAVEDGLIDPKRTVQIGIRGGQNITDGLDYSRDSGMRVMMIEEFDDVGWKQAAAVAREVVGNEPVYLSFDIDALDPVFAPGTGTPEPGGITMREAQRFLRELQGLEFVGGDIVEVSPPFDSAGVTALNAATLLFEMLCLMTD
ncbi:agmatinase [Tropicibacter sp. R16_0]|nr:agmatinase [Tropicibacter sp. R16_0]